MKGYVMAKNDCKQRPVERFLFVACLHQRAARGHGSRNRTTGAETLCFRGVGKAQMIFG
jgi:hypothetical protein